MTDLVRENACLANLNDTLGGSTPLTASHPADTVHDLRVANLDGAPVLLGQLLGRRIARPETSREVIAGVAQDLNHLTVIINRFAEMVVETAGMHPLAHAAGHGLRESVQQLACLADVLSSVTDKRPIIAERIDVNAVLVSVGALMTPFLGHGVTVEIRNDESNAFVTAVHGQLNRIILNLVTNACAAMQGNGRLRLESRTIQIREMNLHSRLKAGEYIMLTVADTGCGMDAQTVSRLCEQPNATYSNRRGLDMVCRLVRDCGGEIFVESRPGKGTHFQVVLPLAH